MLSERLALLVSLDAHGAVKGLESVGKAADRELGKTQAGLARTGKSMQKIGVGMAAVGGLALVGLGKAAKASEEAQLSFLKLENSLANNPRLAGESSKAFVELADSIQGKTAAENDSIIAGEAMLATFRVTGEQIKGLTPLVVDYARKFGVDVVDANKQVGKALDGQVGALKRNGVSIDEVLFKTDRYAAVHKALSQQVGGFAEAEGKTFAGSLERLKNQLGDLEEGVGVGAVDAFSSLLGPVTDVASKIGDLDPAMLSLAGKVATFGAAGLTAAGGVSFLLGKTLELGGSIKDIPNRLKALNSGLSGAGGLAGAAGLAAGGIGLFAAFALKAEARANALKKAAKELADEAEQTGKTLEDVALSKLAETFAASDQVSRAMDDLGVSFADLRDPLQGSKADFEKWAAGMREADKQVGAVGDSGDLLADRVGVLRDQLGKAREVTTRTATATSELGIATGKTGDEQAATATKTKELTDKLKAQADAYDSLLSATLSQFNADIGYRRSLNSTEDALSDVNTALKDHGGKSEEYQRSLLDAEDALLGQADAAARLYDDTAKANGQVLTAAQKQTIYKTELEKVRDTLSPGSPLRKQLDAYITTLGTVPATVGTKILADTSGAFKSVQEYLAYLASQGITSVTGSTVLLKFKQTPLLQNDSAHPADGGLVPNHLAGGGFPGRARGTDTVPAWLTPGEFVMRRSAVQQIGAANLAAMNQGATPRGGGFVLGEGSIVLNGVSDASMPRAVARELRSLAWQLGAA